MLIRLLLGVLFVPLAWGTHQMHLQMRRDLDVNLNVNQQVTLAPPRFLQFVSFGHDALLADLLWLQLIQYYGAAHQQQLPAEHLYQYFDTITTLAPAFEEAYVFSSYLLDDDKTTYQQALKILGKGEANLPQSWLIPFQAGFIHYLHLKQPLEAAEAFQRAGAKPGAPDLPNRLAAQLYKRSNAVERCYLGLQLWQRALEQAPSAELRGKAERHIVETRILCDLLTLRKALEEYTRSRQQLHLKHQQEQQQAIKDAQAKRRRPPKLPPPNLPPALPATLQDLVRAGLLTEVPLDPFGRPYLYRMQGPRVMVQALPWKPIDLSSDDVDS